MPALVIIVDEYAELADEARGAMGDTGSVARLGRAVAVTLVAATQRPTQESHGTRRGSLADGQPHLLQSPRAQRRRPRARLGHARCGLARAFANERAHNCRIGNQQSRLGRILNVMKPASAATRRYLPTSPFKPPPATPPAEQFAVQDQVTHDKHGLGRVVNVEDDIALVIDFGTHQVRITTPCAKLTKL